MTCNPRRTSFQWKEIDARRRTPVIRLAGTKAAHALAAAVDAHTAEGRSRSERRARNVPARCSSSARCPPCWAWCRDTRSRRAAAWRAARASCRRTSSSHSRCRTAQPTKEFRTSTTRRAATRTTRSFGCDARSSPAESRSQCTNSSVTHTRIARICK